MRAHLIQLDIAWEDKAANYDRVERLIGRADPGEGDLIVLPEMFDTGFSLNPGATADRDGATLRQLCQIAGDLGVYLQGSRTVHECHCAKAHNRAVIIGPNGEPVAEYSKVHPFSYGRETEAFEGGRGVVTYDWRAGGESLRVCPAICYDLRFPELFRLGLKAGAEVFATQANWPASRAGHWRALLIARAIENQAYALGVNRAGRDPNLEYAGGSIAVGPRGDVIGELGPEEGVLSVDLNPGHVRSWRETFPAWKDLRLI